MGTCKRGCGCGEFSRTTGRNWDQFAADSFATIERSRNGYLRLAGSTVRGRVAKIVLSEWQLLESKQLQYQISASAEDFRASLKQNVFAEIRKQKWGFVWWLPLVFAIAEIIIKILIQRWFNDRTSTK